MWRCVVVEMCRCGEVEILKFRVEDAAKVCLEVC